MLPVAAATISVLAWPGPQVRPNPHRYIPSGMLPFFLYRAFSLAFLMSVCVTFMRRSRSASMPASVQMALISAPLRSSFAMTNSSKLMSSDKVIFDVWIWKMRRLVFSSGSGNSIFLSMRPGRIRAGSKDSILFVAMITLTSPRSSNPSSWFSSSSMVRWISFSPPLVVSYLFVATASISSMKMMEGECSCATRNISRTSLGPSPKYF
mmetsp:Transcript_70715/g.153572  ORF Transcript_70715/g.153572 Transcript_70715/m.153572 type:complete len:208 (+) Transcript_70715:112-735(+)